MWLPWIVFWDCCCVVVLSSLSLRVGPVYFNTDPGSTVDPVYNLVSCRSWILDHLQFQSCHHLCLPACLVTCLHLPTALCGFMIWDKVFSHYIQSRYVRVFNHSIMIQGRYLVMIWDRYLAMILSHGMGQVFHRDMGQVCSHNMGQVFWLWSF